MNHHSAEDPADEPETRRAGRNRQPSKQDLLRRRLEDRIRHLCTKALAAQDPSELDLIVADLRAALIEHNERLRQRAAAILLGPKDVHFVERRAR